MKGLQVWHVAPCPQAVASLPTVRLGFATGYLPRCWIMRGYWQRGVGEAVRGKLANPRTALGVGHTATRPAITPKRKT